MKNAVKNGFLGVTLFLFLCGNVSIQGNAAEAWQETFQIHGALLGYFGALDLNDLGDSNQFNAAINLDGEMSFSDRLTGGFQIQGSPGGDDLGFSDQLAVTDLYLTFLDEGNTDVFVTFGSFDTPFGDQTEVVSNNADTLRNPFVINSLFMSAWGGIAGTLNTLGVMLGKETELWDLRFAVTNGTGEDVANMDENLEFVVDAGVNMGPVRLAGSYLDSDDREGEKRSGKGADFNGFIVDLKWDLPFSDDKDTYIKGYVGEMEVGDETAGTEDDLSFYMVEAKASFTPSVYLAARYSMWDPDDADGSGTGALSGLDEFSPAIAAGGERDLEIATDQEITRLQIALGYWVSESMVVKLSYFQDDFDKKTELKDTDVSGILLATNLAF